MSTHDDIITLTNADGEDNDFYNIAGIRHKGDFYAILRPVKPLAGMADDEALVFKVTPSKSGDPNYNIVLDDKIVDAVFKKYNKLLDRSEEVGRAIGDPKNMLLDLGVFVVLFMFLLVASLFGGIDNPILIMLLLLGFATDIVYFVIHLVAFLLGKR